MGSDIDYYAILTDGLGGLAPDKFRRLIDESVNWLVNRNIILEEEIELAGDILTDVINLHVPTAGCDDLRLRIIERASSSSNPSHECRKQLRYELGKEVRRRRFAEFSKRIYRQVGEHVRFMESENVLKSNMPFKRSLVGKQIREGLRSKRSTADIACELNRLGLKYGEIHRWTPGDVSRLAKLATNHKRIGLPEWGEGWLEKEPKRDLGAVICLLPVIPLYEGDGENGTVAKVFEYALLRHMIRQTLEHYGAPLTISQLTEVAEKLISRPLYRAGEERSINDMNHAGDQWDESCVHDPLTRPASQEDEVCFVDYLEKLVDQLTYQECEVVEGLWDKHSKRYIAKLLGCSPGTIETIRMRIEEKAGIHALDSRKACTLGEEKATTSGTSCEDEKLKERRITLRQTILSSSGIGYDYDQFKD